MSYFNIFIESQIYGLQFATWDNVRDLENVFVRFLKSCWNLPVGTASATLLSLFDFSGFAMRTFNAKIRFLKRLMNYNSFATTIGVMYISRTVSERLHLGWFEFFAAERRRYGITETMIEILQDGNSFLVVIQDAYRFEIINRVSVLPSAQFFNSIFFIDLVCPDVIDALSDLTFETFRLSVMFLSGVITWSIFRSNRSRCYRCLGNMNVVHLLSCDVMFPGFEFTGVSHQRLINLAADGEWHLFFEKILEVLYLWSIESSNIVETVRIHIDDYLQNQ
jgi:hypothetical protein